MSQSKSSVALRGLLLALMAASAAQAWAQVPGDAQSARVDRRQAQQAERIGQGVASGELTRGETRRLAREQRHIARLEHRTEADGVVTRREAARVELAQDRASARIAHAKHDRQARPGAR